MNNNRSTPRHPQRRGVAMILVLVSISVAIVIAGVALTSRDTTAAIGKNAAADAKAAWAAESAANIAATAIAKNISTWTDASDTQLMTDYNFADAMVDIEITDLEGGEPDADDRIVRMKIAAEVDGITKTIIKEIALAEPVDLGDAADPWLGEFAIFASQRVQIGNNAHFRVWDRSAKSISDDTVKVGGAYTSIADVDLNSPNIYNVAFFPSDSSATAVKDAALNDARYAEGWVIPMEVPVFPCAIPAALDATPSLGDMALNTGTVVEFNETARKDWAFDSLSVTNGTRLIIRGDVRIRTLDSLYIDEASSIEVEDGGSLMFFAGSEVQIRGNSSFGLPEGATTYSDVSAYKTAGDVKLIGLTAAQGASNDANVIIRENSSVRAVIHTPEGYFDLSEKSALIGRVTATHVLMDDATLFYDPELDTESGYTTADGPLYNQTTKQPIDGLTDTLTSFNWASGFDAFSTWFETEMSSYDNTDAGTSGGIIKMTEDLVIESHETSSNFLLY